MLTMVKLVYFYLVLKLVNNLSSFDRSLIEVQKPTATPILRPQRSNYFPLLNRP